MNEIARLELEFIYNNVAIEHVSHYATLTSLYLNVKYKTKDNDWE